MPGPISSPKVLKSFLITSLQVIKTSFLSQICKPTGTLLIASARIFSAEFNFSRIFLSLSMFSINPIIRTARPSSFHLDLPRIRFHSRSLFSFKIRVSNSKSSFSFLKCCIKVSLNLWWSWGSRISKTSCSLEKFKNCEAIDS